MTNRDIDIGFAVTTVKHNTRYMLHVLVGSRSTTGGKPGKHNILQLYCQYIITVDTSGGSRIYRTGWYDKKRELGGHHFCQKFSKICLKIKKNKWSKTVCVGRRGHCIHCTPCNGGFRSAKEMHLPICDPNVLIFTQFLGKIDQIKGWRLACLLFRLLKLAPPLGNPGSSTAAV